MKFDWIVNKLRERIYPYTHADAVIMDEENTKLSEKFEDVDSHISNNSIHVPSGGSTGQVLTKTESGNNWAAVSSGEGTYDYNELENQPKINNVTLSGNKSLNDLGVTATAIGVEEGANNYVHPDTHSASIIVEDDTHQFVTIEDKEKWNFDNNIIVLKDQILIFDSLICTIENDKVTTDSLADVYFTSDTIDAAENANISVETYSGNLQLTAKQIPVGNIKATIVVRNVL